MQRGQWPPVWREALSGIKDKAYMNQRPVRGCGQTNWSSRGPREAMGLAFERRLEACVSDKRCSLPLPIIGYFGPVGQKATDLTLTDEACWGQSLTGDSCPNPHNLFSQHACTHRFVQRVFHHQLSPAEYLPWISADNNLLLTFTTLCGK